MMPFSGSWKHIIVLCNKVFSFIIFLHHRWPIEQRWSQVSLLYTYVGIHQVRILVFDNYKKDALPLSAWSDHRARPALWSYQGLIPTHKSNVSGLLYCVAVPPGFMAPTSGPRSQTDTVSRPILGCDCSSFMYLEFYFFFVCFLVITTHCYKEVIWPVQQACYIV